MIAVDGGFGLGDGRTNLFVPGQRSHGAAFQSAMVFSFYLDEPPSTSTRSFVLCSSNKLREGCIPWCGGTVVRRRICSRFPLSLATEFHGFSVVYY